jgi:hypothetical protein
MSQDNFEKSESGLFTPRATRSSGKALGKMSVKDLAINIKSAATFKKIIFGAVLVYLAYTTYLFGEENLTSFAMSAAGKLSATDTAQVNLARFLAGLMAVLVTDGLARAWPKIKAGSAETNAQRIAADVGSISSIVVSFYFTAAVLTAQFPTQFSPDFISALAFVGAVMFVLISIINGACIVIFLASDIATIEQNVSTRILSTKISEELSAKETIRTQGLLQASKEIQDDLPLFVAMMKDAMSYEMRASILADVEDEQVKARLTQKYLDDLPAIEPLDSEVVSSKNEREPYLNGRGSSSHLT